MPKRPTFKPLLTPDGYLVSIPASMSGTGKRKKRYFAPKEYGTIEKAEKAADKFAAQLRKDYHAGLRGGTISPQLATMAAEAQAMLEPFGLTILDAAKAAVERRKANDNPETFEERWTWFVKEGETHWRGRYAKDMGKIPRWVGSKFMAMRVADITPEILDRALRENGAKAKSTIEARADRVNSVLVGKGHKKRSAKVKILTPSQLRRLKRHARKDDEVRRVIGLLLFAGIRPGAEDGEISRLDWSMVGKREIYIDHDTAKTSTDRHIPLTPRLKWWIRGHPSEGPVAPARWPKKWQALRRLAGIGREQDITRHTFASHYLVVFGSDKAKEAMGHTKDSDTLFRHYRRSVTDRKARRYFRMGT